MNLQVVNYRPYGKPEKDSYAIFPEDQSWALCYHMQEKQVRLWKPVKEGPRRPPDLQPYFPASGTPIGRATCHDLLTAIAMANRFAETGELTGDSN